MVLGILFMPWSCSKAGMREGARGSSTGSDEDCREGIRDPGALAIKS
jgi:hypothetical protein